MPSAGIISPNPTPHSPPIQWSQNILRPDAFQKTPWQPDCPRMGMMGFWWFPATPTPFKIWGKTLTFLGPPQVVGLGGFPWRRTLDRKRVFRNSARSLGHLPPSPPGWFQGSRPYHPISPQKPVSRHPKFPFGGGPFPGPKFYPLGRDSEKSSNSLQELADEQRLRKLSTRAGSRE